MQTLKSEEIHIICELCCETQNRERAKELILEFIEPARGEEGCLYYDLYQKIEDPRNLQIKDSGIFIFLNL